MRDGGPAFPIQASPYVFVTAEEKGMTLLDHFAGKSLEGLRSNPNDESGATETAKYAYGDARAMLEERERLELEAQRAAFEEKTTLMKKKPDDDDHET